MEDVITANAPPSRFLLEDLNNFATTPPPLPNPFLLFSAPYLNERLAPSLLIVAMSSPSLHFLHHVPSKTLVGTLVLPEIPFSGNSLEPCLGDKSCNIYALDSENGSVLLVSVQFQVPAERSHLVAKLLIGGQIIPEKVLILDSAQSRNFRGKLSMDDPFAFKLETSVRGNKPDGGKAGDTSMLKGVDYFPSGSVIEGLSAAVLSRCEMRRIEGTLFVSWPEFGWPVLSLVKTLLLRDVLPGVEHRISGEDEASAYLRLGPTKDHFRDSELYT